MLYVCVVAIFAHSVDNIFDAEKHRKERVEVCMKLSIMIHVFSLIVLHAVSH